MTVCVRARGGGGVGGGGGGVGEAASISLYKEVGVFFCCKCSF